MLCVEKYISNYVKFVPFAFSQTQHNQDLSKTAK